MNRVVSTLLPLPVHVAAVWLILVLMGLEVRTCLVNHYLTAFLSFPLTLSFYPPLSVSICVSLFLCLCLSLYLSLPLSIYYCLPFFISPSLCLFLHLSLFPFLLLLLSLSLPPPSLNFPPSSSPSFLFSTFFILSRLHSFLIYSCTRTNRP